MIVMTTNNSLHKGHVLTHWCAAQFAGAHYAVEGPICTKNIIFTQFSIFTVW